eukprot:4397153-Lingulodinium_polyedra.AAC.1
MARERLVNLTVAAVTHVSLEGQRCVPARLRLGAPLNAAQRHGCRPGAGARAVEPVWVVLH